MAAQHVTEFMQIMRGLIVSASGLVAARTDLLEHGSRHLTVAQESVSVLLQLSLGHIPVRATLYGTTPTGEVAPSRSTLLRTHCTDLLQVMQQALGSFAIPGFQPGQGGSDE